MSEKQFVVETVEITDCDTDVSRIAKVITDTKETYSYEDLDEIVHKLNEQQDTIRKLQDLCGESDGENAKLRLKNKKLQDKIDMLCEKYDYPNEKDKTKVVKNDKQS